MAEMIPDTLPASSTAGERRVFAALARLPDDCLIYYEPVVRRRYPDLIATLPEVVVLVIEVKDWQGCPGENEGRLPGSVVTSRRGPFNDLLVEDGHLTTSDMKVKRRIRAPGPRRERRWPNVALASDVLYFGKSGRKQGRRRWC